MPVHMTYWLLLLLVSPSRVQLFTTPWTVAFQTSLSFTISLSLPKFMFIALVTPSSHLILWCPVFLLPSIFPSVRDFSWVLCSHQFSSVQSVMPSSHLILCRPLLLLPPIPPSIRVFSKESTLRMRCPKYWSFSFSISPSKEHPGLISFRMDWLDLLAVQGTLKSLLQHHSSKALILQCSAFFTVQLSHPYMTTGKTIALTRRTFVGSAF